ncbi:MAG: hypothetical protein IT585_14950 [candidate division Zixibacteria bacterium]|nr:hypothetical protein [candidate division Zixibacteria bacterium]
MKKVILIALVVVVAAGVISLGYVVYREQRADYGWSPVIDTPAFDEGTGPRVLVDQAHNNASTIGIAGRYWPFGKLLRADGYRVAKGKDKFTTSLLNETDILVIVNASGAPKPQFLGFNLPIGTEGDRSAAAFTTEEVAAIVEWVKQGGSLLLIADHAPFGAASAGLAEAFGVKMYCGFVEVPDEISDPLLFSDVNGRLGDHPILTGGPTPVRRVMTFTGQSLQTADSAAILLRLPANAVEYIPQAEVEGRVEMKQQPAGNAQGLAFDFGNGRVVILGEAAMLTAQVYRGEEFGMNRPDCDNELFARNVMRWLARKL